MSFLWFWESATTHQLSHWVLYPESVCQGLTASALEGKRRETITINGKQYYVYLRSPQAQAPVDDETLLRKVFCAEGDYPDRNLTQGEIIRLPRVNWEVVGKSFGKTVTTYTTGMSIYEVQKLVKERLIREGREFREEPKRAESSNASGKIEKKREIEETATPSAKRTYTAPIPSCLSPLHPGSNLEKLTATCPSPSIPAIEGKPLDMATAIVTTFLSGKHPLALFSFESMNSSTVFVAYDQDVVVRSGSVHIDVPVSSLIELNYENDKVSIKLENKPERYGNKIVLIFAA